MTDSDTSMPKIRTILADDEQLARQKLRILLEGEPWVQIVAECNNLMSTQAALRDYRPDLLLLDIEMPGGSGFDALRGLTPSEAPIVIFTTAYDKYAVRAFEMHALDYLLKPFDQSRLHEAVERARVELLKSRDRVFTSQLLELLKAPPFGSPSDDRLVIKAGGRVVLLNPEEIDYVEASANYVSVHAGKNSYLLREAIGRIATRLDSKKFVRIHRSFIVNVMKIKEFVPCGSGEFMAVLRDDRELPCSRTYRSAVQTLLGKASA